MPNVKQRLRVFLSYAREDVTAVRDLHEKLLEEPFVEPWMDEYKLLPGQEWGREILSSLRSSDVVLLFLSRTSLEKEGYVQRELRHAIDISKEKPLGDLFIIPVRIEQCALPPELAQLQWVNLFESSGYQRLLDSLRAKAEALEQRLLAATSKGLGSRTEPLAQNDERPDPVHAAKSQQGTQRARRLSTVNRWVWMVLGVITILAGAAFLFWYGTHRRYSGVRSEPKGKIVSVVAYDVSSSVQPASSQVQSAVESVIGGFPQGSDYTVFAFADGFQEVLAGARAERAPFLILERQLLQKRLLAGGSSVKANRTCIIGFLDFVGHFLESVPGNATKHLYIVSDMIEDCNPKFSHMLRARSTVDLADYLRTRKGRPILNGVSVSIIIPTELISSQLYENQLLSQPTLDERQAFWNAIFQAYGATVRWSIGRLPDVP